MGPPTALPSAASARMPAIQPPDRKGPPNTSEPPSANAGWRQRRESRAGGWSRACAGKLHDLKDEDPAAGQELAWANCTTLRMKNQRHDDHPSTCAYTGKPQGQRQRSSFSSAHTSKQQEASTLRLRWKTSGSEERANRTNEPLRTGKDRPIERAGLGAETGRMTNEDPLPAICGAEKAHQSRYTPPRKVNRMRPSTLYRRPTRRLARLECFDQHAVRMRDDDEDVSSGLTVVDGDMAMLRREIAISCAIQAGTKS